MARLSLTGGFGGGTAKLQNRDSEGNIIDVAGGSFTAITDTFFDFPPHAVNYLRINMAGATNPTLVIFIQGATADF